MSWAKTGASCFSLKPTPVQCAEANPVGAHRQSMSRCFYKRCKRVINSNFDNRALSLHAGLWTLFYSTVLCNDDTSQPLWRYPKYRCNNFIEESHDAQFIRRSGKRLARRSCGHRERKHSFRKWCAPKHKQGTPVTPRGIVRAPHSISVGTHSRFARLRYFQCDLQIIP